MELKYLDLNLLVALDALLQERSVTKAAQRLGLSQPSLSASLGRLRRHFGDELLARVGNTYALTPLGVQLKGRTSAALIGVDRVFTAQSTFDPATSKREFLLLASDYGVRVLARDLAEVIDEHAPGTRLRLHHHTTEAIDHAVETLRTVDGIILPHGFLHELPFLDLYVDQWVCLVSEDNSTVGEELTVEQLRELPWVFTYHGPTAFTPAARQMRMHGIEARVQVVTESFLTVPDLIQGTERIALMQAKLARRILPGTGVRAMSCPFTTVPLVQALWWHPMYDRDPEHQFLRTAVAEAARRVAAFDDEYETPGATAM